MAAPELICLEHFGGNYERWIDAVYDCYLSTVVRGGLRFNGKIIACKRDPETNGKGFAFWHCVSEEGRTKAEDDRVISPRRCERISWIAHAIENARPDGEVVWWEVKRGTRTRVVIWMVQEEFAVILEERQNFYLLWTTYDVRSGRANTFSKEHKFFWDEKARAAK